MITMNVMGTKPTFDVFGLGSSLVDVTIRTRRRQLGSFGLQENEQKFVDADEARRTLAKITRYEKTVRVGGSVRNTMQGLSLFGERTAMFATVGQDRYGRLVRDDLKTHHIEDRLFVVQTTTGFCLVFVTEHGERSMITFGGDENEVATNVLPADDIRQAKILYSSAYLFNSLNGPRFFEDSFSAASCAGTIVAFDLADPKVVRENQGRIWRLIDDGVIDILLGNSLELENLFGMSVTDAIPKMRETVPLVVAKLGARGAIVVTKGDIYNIPPCNNKVEDTTGAGDMFAAAFLHGLLRNYPVDVCGHLGALVAGDCIGHLGVRLSENIVEQVRSLLVAHGVTERMEGLDRAEWLDNFKTRYADERGQNNYKRQGIVQICGIRSLCEAKILLAIGATMIAFPLCLPVHREDVTSDEAAEIISELARDRCVLITYLERCEDIVALAQKIGVKNIQLHGEISVDEIKKLRAKDRGFLIVKSLIVKPDADFEELAGMIALYGEHVDAFIIDTFDPQTGASGATGKTHDWSLSRKLVEISPKPVLLAGGLNPDNVYQAILTVRPAGVTVHTGVESADGNKDSALVNRFVEEVRRGFGGG